MGVFDYLRGLGWGDTAQPMPALGQDDIQQQSPALARLGTAPTMQSAGADVPVNTPLGQAILPHLAQGMADAVMAPGRAYNGQMAVRDPQSGELTQEATDWGAGTALGMLGASSVPRVAVAPGEAVVGSGPIRAYHGSPHDFDAFDLSKIGTGEGAQAYGHGMYFAENEGVAQAYRDALQTFPLGIEGTASRFLNRGGGDHEEALKLIQASADRMRAGGKADIADEYAQAASILNDWKGRNYKPGGRMYEVGIHADPQAFLDYDTPLGGKPRWLDQALKPAGTNLREVAGTALGDGDPAKLTGRHIYQEVENYLGSPEAASQALQQGGIPGIRYLDQGSRGTGSGSSNYVVFNPQIVEIMRKYGVASLAALPPGVLASMGLGSNGEQAVPQQ